MAWTSIDADTSWQELAIAQEIATAYNKRVAALPGSWKTASGVDVVYPDEDMTVFDFVRALQDGIEAIATCFSNPVATLTGLDALPGNWGSVSSMMTYAGLTESGYWRRIPEGGTQPSAWTTYNAAGWSYGKITDKDLAGPWLFRDLQVAITALTRIVCPSTGAYAETYDSEEWGSHDQVTDSVVPTGYASRTITEVSSFTTSVAFQSEKCTYAGIDGAVDYIFCIYSLHMYALLCGKDVSGSTANRKVIGIMGGSSNDPFTALTGLTSVNYKKTYEGITSESYVSGDTTRGWIPRNPGLEGPQNSWTTIADCLPDPPDDEYPTITMSYGDCVSVTDYDFDL